MILEIQEFKWGERTINDAAKHNRNEKTGVTL